MTPGPDDVCDLVEPAGTPVLDRGAAGARPPSDLVRSVSRALTVLEVVGAAGGPISAKAIARRTGVNLSTTYHLLRTLCWEGYLVRLPQGDFGLGAAISRRYRELVTSLSAPDPMRQVVHRLTAVTGLTGYLGRLVDGRPAVTDVVLGPTPEWAVPLSPGFDEADGTPLGQALLATPPLSGTPTGGGAALVIEDGRLRPDLSCAAVTVRRVTSRPSTGPGQGLPGGEPVRWAVGLLGPLGSFAGGAPALRALVRASEQLANLTSIPPGMTG
jgi:hypothetical protein